MIYIGALSQNVFHFFVAKNGSDLKKIKSSATVCEFDYDFASFL